MHDRGQLEYPLVSRCNPPVCTHTSRALTSFARGGERWYLVGVAEICYHPHATTTSFQPCVFCFPLSLARLVYGGKVQRACGMQRSMQNCSTHSRTDDAMTGPRRASYTSPSTVTLSHVMPPPVWMAAPAALWVQSQPFLSHVFVCDEGVSFREAVSMKMMMTTTQAPPCPEHACGGAECLPRDTCSNATSRVSCC